jgi:RNA polymerase sigma-70 factor (ECF subfamily)
MLSPKGQSTVDSILERIARGDSEAVRHCVDLYGGLVWSMARRRGLAPEDAEDIVQEVFLDLWRSANRFDAAQASEPAFVAMITRRRLIDRLRRQQRRPQTQETLEMLEIAGNDLQRIENRVEATLAARALATLKPRERDVLLLSTYHGLSHGQIAAHTGIPLGTVKTYIRRGLIRVRELLEGGRQMVTRPISPAICFFFHAFEGSVCMV